eukprot:TRINITY_DN1097_c0_g1_i2.p2 TRINITY_DN1097_c0_g1~~TRINITY_DN1097_c0_g1_i2.p2  ORF type:complete len:139 (+),score=8.74 TRINITY_DN1097_c0_g1_i2:53-418(+)
MSSAQLIQPLAGYPFTRDDGTIDLKSLLSEHFMQEAVQNMLDAGDQYPSHITSKQGCKCLSQWTFNGNTYYNCANPDDWHSQWCVVDIHSCPVLVYNAALLVVKSEETVVGLADDCVEIDL